jgi:hypothetical protein
MDEPILIDEDLIRSIAELYEEDPQTIMDRVSLLEMEARWEAERDYYSLANTSNLI